MCNYNKFDDWYDYCDECRIYGDDFYVDENEEWIDTCENCFMNTENTKNKESEKNEET